MYWLLQKVPTRCKIFDEVVKACLSIDQDNRLDLDGILLLLNAIEQNGDLLVLKPDEKKIRTPEQEKLGNSSPRPNMKNSVFVFKEETSGYHCFILSVSFQNYSDPKF